MLVKSCGVCKPTSISRSLCYRRSESEPSRMLHRLLSVGIIKTQSYTDKTATPDEWIASITKFMLAQECGAKVPLHVLATKVPRPQGVKGNLGKLLVNAAESSGLTLTGEGDSLRVALSANISWILLIAKYLHSQDSGTRLPLHILGTKVPRPEGATGSLGKLLAKKAESFGLMLVGNGEVEVTLSPTTAWILSIVKHLHAQDVGTEVPLHILAAKVSRPDGAKGNLSKIIAKQAEAFGLVLTGSGDTMSVRLLNSCPDRESMTTAKFGKEPKQNSMQQLPPSESASSAVSCTELQMDTRPTPISHLEGGGITDFSALIARLKSSGLIQQEITLRDRALEDNQGEAELRRKVLEHQSRHCSRAEAAHEDDLLDRIAGKFGCEDRDILVERLARVWGENEQMMRTKLIVAIKEALVMAKQLILHTVPSSSADSRKIDDFLSSFRIAVQDQVLPTTHTFPSNQEVDNHHEKCMAVVRECTAKGGSWIKNIYAEKSPLGTLASGVGLDELSEVGLLTLLNNPGSPVHCFKITLTVVKPAFMAGAVTAIVSDTTGQHVRIAVYNTGCITINQAQSLLPLGSRFSLKQPFLKRCSDTWLGLRVDEPRSLVRLDLPLSGRILVVGDGDFSFSRALCRRNVQLGADAHITATSLDSRQTVLEKYPTALSILEELDKNPLVEVLHGVDATSLLSTISNERPFDIVVWNFPYPVSSRCLQASQGAMLVNEFLASVGEDAVLTECGRVYISLASRQGGTTREAKRLKHSWRMEDVSVKNGFDLLEVIPFNAMEYVGYTPRRAFSDESFPHEDARMHILQRSRSQRLTAATETTGYEMLSSKDRHFGGRLASAIHSAPFRRNAISPQTGRRVIPNCLAAFAAKSETARSLLVAEETFDAVYQFISNYSSLNCHDAVAARRVVALLDKAYSVRDGELVACWPSAGALRFALDCALRTCGTCFAEIYQDAELAVECSKEQISLEVFLLAVGKTRVNSAAKLTQAQGDLLCSSTYVLSCLLMHFQLEDPLRRVDSMPGSEAANTTSAPACMDYCFLLLARVAIMKIADARVYRRIACIYAFHVNQLCSEGDDQELKSEKEQALEETLTKLLATCDLLLHTDPDDMSALHLKAFALRSYTPSWTGDVLSPQYAARLRQAIALHEQYLALAEPDDRFKPDAHYSIGALKLAVGLSSAEPSARDGVILSALRDYNRGLEAEKSQLPCLPPRGPVDAKEILATMRVGYPGS